MNTKVPFALRVMLHQLLTCFAHTAAGSDGRQAAYMNKTKLHLTAPRTLAEVSLIKYKAHWKLIVRFLQLH